MANDQTDQAADEYDARLDKVIAEATQTINQAHDVSASLRKSLQEVGSNNVDTMRTLFSSDECPEEIRRQAGEELQQLDQELAEEEERLMHADAPPANRGQARAARRGMTRI